jgi:hypothetical protein
VLGYVAVGLVVPLFAFATFRRPKRPSPVASPTVSGPLTCAQLCEMSQGASRHGVVSQGATSDDEIKRRIENSPEFKDAAAAFEANDHSHCPSCYPHVHFMIADGPPATDR